MSFTTRLVAGFVTLGVLGGVLGFLAFNGTTTITDNFDEYTGRSLPLVQSLFEMEQSSLRILASANEAVVLELLGHEDSPELEVELARIEAATASLDEAIATHSDLVERFFPEEGELADATRLAGDRFLADAAALLAVIEPRDFSQLDELRERLEKSEASLLAVLAEATSQEEQELAEHQSAVSDAGSDLLLTLVVGGALLAIVMACLGAVLVGSYNRLDESRIQAEGQLKVANERVQQERLRKARFEVLGQVTATVSHELRNPLGTIRTSLFSLGEQIRRAGVSGTAERPLARIDRSVTRCEAIVADLLDYTRVKELALDHQPVDVWLDEVLDEMSSPKGLALHRDLAAHAIVDMDPERLRRAIVNVWENAVHAFSQDGQTPPDDLSGARIDVTTQVEDEHVVISVIDNGRGMPPDMLEQIFEPLFTTKTRGVGLGLPTVRQIVDQHGGTVVAKNNSRGGVTVTMRIPVSEIGVAKV